MDLKERSNLSWKDFTYFQDTNGRLVSLSKDADSECLLDLIGEINKWRSIKERNIITIETALFKDCEAYRIWYMDMIEKQSAVTQKMTIGYKDFIKDTIPIIKRFSILKLKYKSMTSETSQSLINRINSWLKGKNLRVICLETASFDNEEGVRLWYESKEEFRD